MSVCRHCGFDHEFTNGRCPPGPRLKAAEALTAKLDLPAFLQEPVTPARNARVTRPRNTKVCPRCKGKGHVPAPLSAAERMRALRARGQ